MADKKLGVQTIRTGEIKLKDSKKRRMITLDLKKVFGFIPKKIIIEKKFKENNNFFVHAVLTTKMLKKEAEKSKDKEIKEDIKKVKKGKDGDSKRKTKKNT